MGVWAIYPAWVATQPTVRAIVLMILHDAGPPIWKAGRGIAVGWFAICISEATFNMLTLFVGDDTRCSRLVADSVSFLVIAGTLCTLADESYGRSAHPPGQFTCSKPPPTLSLLLSFSPPTSCLEKQPALMLSISNQALHTRRNRRSNGVRLRLLRLDFDAVRDGHGLSRLAHFLSVFQHTSQHLCNWFALDEPQGIGP